MPVFKITTYPANKCERGLTSIAITNPISRTEVECKMEDLPAKLEQAANAATSPMADMPGIQAWADPVGRAPNGYKKFSAAKKDMFYRAPA